MTWSVSVYVCECGREANNLIETSALLNKYFPSAGNKDIFLVLRSDNRAKLKMEVTGNLPLYYNHQTTTSPTLLYVY